MKTTVAVLAVLLVTQAAYAVNVDREDFPSASSTVVGSVGFIDATQVGYFWSKARGDSVTQTFVTTETNVTRAVFDFITPFNDLIGFNVDWNVLLNGALIGTFSIAPGESHQIHLDFSFAPITGPSYTVRFEVTSESGGTGSVSIGYAGANAGTVQLFGVQLASLLKCYKIKDKLTKAAYTADLTGLASEPGCRISVPAKQLCVSSDATNVSPTPPGDGPPTGGVGAKFVCYTIKCPKGVAVPVSVGDQFGSRSVTATIGGKLFCVPAL
jgi:hypothetical protein